MKSAITPELLAPAGGREALCAAVRCGADAVYMGAQQFSARHSAENFSPEALSEAAALCHRSGVKLYLAVNTLLTAREFPALDTLAEQAAAAGIDGCIVQDLGVAAYLKQKLPQLPLHASTQMTVHTAEGIAAAGEMGLCRVVLARELSQKQIGALTAAAHAMGMETEVFVHGAHCMSVSGQCWLSAAMGGRSANRGRCAQPCRLPFSADGDPEACALSLKDMCLLAHAKQLAEMGVDSLKIEGRMKRPEYVAAAVSAYREALDGGTPDVDTLRAVFSRSGFTDGYFTGRRVQMFGTRRKEDVLAAEPVLAKLRETYRKPRKITDLHGHFTLRMGADSLLTVTDGDGNTATVTGEMPQQALRRPADVESLRRQMEKLGDTIYRCGDVTAEIHGDVMLPAAAVNGLRRRAAEALNAVRIRANTPVYTQNAPLLPAADPVQPWPVQERWIMVRRLSQLEGLKDALRPTDRLLLPLHLAKGYLAAPLLPLERCILLPPRWCEDSAHTRRQLEEACASGFTHLGCGHVGDVQMGRSLGYTLHGTVGLHITNPYAAAMLKTLGLADGLLSPEIPPQHSRQTENGLPLGVFAYGRLPLMLTRNCPVQAQVGCKHCRHLLTDRKGQALYTDCVRDTDTPDYAELFNSAVVWLADKPALYRNARYLLFAFTDESAERVGAVLRAYGDEGDKNPPARFTRGLRCEELLPKKG